MALGLIGLRSQPMRRLGLVPVVAFTAMLLLATSARAEDEEDRKAAAKLFTEGQKAYKDGDYRSSADAFERAYKRAPRLQPLWNAARAWDKSGESTRAANLYASYLRKAPPDAPDRNSATSALQKLETKVTRLEIHATGFTDLKIDGAPCDLDGQTPAALVLYVTPGAHLVQGTHDDKDEQQQVLTNAGGSTSVVLVVKAAAPAVVVSPPPAQPPPPPAAKARSGVSPTIVVVGGGLTAVAGGFLIWSSIDTLDQKKIFLANPSQQNLDVGRADEMRTNILVGVTGALGVLTGVAAVFIVDWKGRTAAEKTAETTSISARVGPGNLSVVGTF